MSIFKRGKEEENLDIGEIERGVKMVLKPKHILSHASPHTSYTSHAQQHKAPHGITRTQCNTRTRHGISQYGMHACKEENKGQMKSYMHITLSYQ